MFDPITLLAALGPLVVKGGEALINKYIAPDSFKPVTIADWVTMKELDLKQFELLNNAGGTNPTYPWVEAIIRLMRPTIAVGVIGTWSLCKFFPQLACGPEVDNFAAAIGFYLFGDRSLFYATKK